MGRMLFCTNSDSVFDSPSVYVRHDSWQPLHVGKQMTSLFLANPTFASFFSVFSITAPLIPVDPKALASLTPPDVQMTAFLIIVAWGFNSLSQQPWQDNFVLQLMSLIGHTLVVRVGLIVSIWTFIYLPFFFFLLTESLCNEKIHIKIWHVPWIYKGRRALKWRIHFNSVSLNLCGLRTSENSRFVG